METANQMHRLSTVRRQQGASLHEIAQRLGTPLDHVTWQETETSDLWLSELWAWQGELGVPIENLLIDRHSPLQGPVIERSQIHHLMKIVSHICDRAPSLGVQRLGARMIAQLLEIMPEENP